MIDERKVNLEILDKKSNVEYAGSKLQYDLKNDDKLDEAVKYILRKNNKYYSKDEDDLVVLSGGSLILNTLNYNKIIKYGGDSESDGKHYRYIYDLRDSNGKIIEEGKYDYDFFIKPSAEDEYEKNKNMIEIFRDFYEKYDNIYSGFTRVNLLFENIGVHLAVQYMDYNATRPYNIILINKKENWKYLLHFKFSATRNSFDCIRKFIKLHYYRKVIMILINYFYDISNNSDKTKNYEVYNFDDINELLINSEELSDSEWTLHKIRQTEIDSVYNVNMVYNTHNFIEYYYNKNPLQKVKDFRSSHELYEFTFTKENTKRFKDFKLKGNFSTSYQFILCDGKIDVSDSLNSITKTTYEVNIYKYIENYFDISVCKIAYNGYSLKILTDAEEFMRKEIRIRENMPRWKFIKLFERLEKYEKRGFQLIDYPENIMKYIFILSIFNNNYKFKYENKIDEFNKVFQRHKSEKQNRLKNQLRMLEHSEEDIQLAKDHYHINRKLLVCPKNPKMQYVNNKMTFSKLCDIFDGIDCECDCKEDKNNPEGDSLSDCECSCHNKETYEKDEKKLAELREELLKIEKVLSNIYDCNSYILKFTQKIEYQPLLKIINSYKNKDIYTRSNYLIDNVDYIVEHLEEYLPKKELTELTKYLEDVQRKFSEMDKNDFGTKISFGTKNSLRYSNKNNYIEELRYIIDKYKEDPEANFKKHVCENIIEIIGDMFLDLHYEEAQKNPNYYKLHFFLRYLL